MTEGSGRSPRNTALILAGFFLVFAGPGAIQGFLRDVLPSAWSRIQVTSLLAAVYLSFMVWRMLVVRTQHAIGDKWSFVCGLASYLIIPVALLFTTNYFVLLALAAVWGWGSASLWQTGPVWLYDATDPRRRGLWAGLLYMLVFLGLIVGAQLEAGAAHAGRRTLLLLLAIVPGALGVLAAMLLPARPARAEPLSLAGVRSLARDRRVIILGVLLLISSTAYGLLLGAFRDSIEAAYGAGAVGTALSAYFAVRLVVSIAGGHFSDVLARRTVMAATFLAGGTALFATVLWEGRPALMIASACLGLVSGIVPCAATALSADWFPPEKRSLAMGAAFVWQDAGMAVSLLAGQYIVHATGSFRASFLAFAVLFVISTAAALVLPEGTAVEEAEARA